MSVREAFISDAEAINQLALELGYSCSSIAATKQRLSDIISTTNDKVWVFERQGSVVGWLHAFVALKLASPSFVEIGGLVVDSTCRRNGIGRSLVEQTQKWAKEKALNVRVRCNTERENSHLFYRSAGFTTVKSQHVFESNL